MKWLDWFRNIFEDDITTEMEVHNEPKPFLTFPCGECEHSIIIDNLIFPGDVVVIKCDNCNESWSVYCRSLQISKTSEFEEVWPHIAEDVEKSAMPGVN